MTFRGGSGLAFFGRISAYVSRARHEAGYTILEVLIFVALTSVMLVIAVSNITGNQRQTQFAQSARGFESVLNDVLNDTPTGYFPTNDTIGCRIDAVTNDPEIYNASAQTLGSNVECVYVGKALQFAPNGDTNKVWVYPLAGRRLALGTSEPVDTIDEARPVAVSIPTDPGFTDAVQEISLQNDVRVTKIINADTSAEYGSVAILTRFEGANPAGVADAQLVRVGAINGTSQGQNKITAVSAINMLKDPGTLITSTKGIVLCIADSFNHKASIIIGENSSGGVQLDFDSLYGGCI